MCALFFVFCNSFWSIDRSLLRSTRWSEWAGLIIKSKRKNRRSPGDSVIRRKKKESEERHIHSTDSIEERRGKKVEDKAKKSRMCSCSDQDVSKLHSFASSHILEHINLMDTTFQSLIDRGPRNTLSSAHSLIHSLNLKFLHLMVLH